jgi:hypothetical protein
VVLVRICSGSTRGSFSVSKGSRRETRTDLRQSGEGSIARVTNGMAFSCPGYNEMLTGASDKHIDSNQFVVKPIVTVFEWLNGTPD